jgi:hypothetical protein
MLNAPFHDFVRGGACSRYDDGVGHESLQNIYGELGQYRLAGENNITLRTTVRFAGSERKFL